MSRATSEAAVTIRYVVRAMRLRFVMVGVVLGAGAVGLSHLVDSGPFASPHTGFGLGLVTIAIGAAFALDDPAAATIASSPISLRRRSAVRLAVTAVLVALGVVALGAVAWERLAYVDALGQSAGLLVIGVGAAAAAGRIAGWDRPGIVGAAMVIALILADGLSLLPADDPLLTGGAGRPAPAVVTDLTWLLLLAVLGGAYVWGTRDPAGRRRG